MKPMVDEALALAERGFRIVPIHTPGPNGCSCENGPACGCAGKHPRLNAWQKESTCDSRIIRGWWRSWPLANIGLAMGGESRLVAVDVDGPTGRATLAKLEAEHGALPATLTSRSGRVDGGEHRFFRVPDGLDLRRIKNRAGRPDGPMPRVDIRAEGGQVVAPPSLHASGNRYAWQDREVPIAELPRWLYELATWEPAAPPVPEGPPRSSGVRMDVASRARAYLGRIPPAISGQGGHSQTLLAAEHMVRGFELDDGMALLLLLDWNRSCQPPWSERELRHKVREAREKGTAVAWGAHLKDDWAPPPRAHRAEPEPSYPVPEAPTKQPAEEPYDPATGEIYDTAAEAEVERAEAEAIAAEPATPQKEPAWKKHGVRTLYEVLHGVYQRVTSPEPRVFVSTGNAELDYLIGGYRPARVTVVGASTSWGKSSFLVMAFDEGTRVGKRVLVVSGEDGEDLYGKRIAARRGDINAFRLRDHDLNPREKDRLLYEAEKAERVPFFIDGVGTTAEKLANIISELCKEQPYDLIGVDYLQAFKCAARKQDRRNEITHIARCFIDAIKGANAAGLVFSQIKRLEDGKVPTKHDLKESGDVENMAEHVLMGYCETEIEQATGETRRDRYIIVDKNKDGPVVANAIALPFDARTASFKTTTIRNAQPDEQRYAQEVN